MQRWEILPLSQYLRMSRLTINASQNIVAVFSLSPDENPLLEIKYRSKKNRERDPDSDRVESQYSTPSTPDYKSERRRGSKVGGILSHKIIKPCLA